jgi:signal transduction histidine kinase
VWTQLGPLAHELDVALVEQVGADEALLDIDAEKIERVLLNLVDNALKFSPGGGQIVVRLHAPGTNGAPPHFCRVDVSDSGPGIPPEDRAYIFDRFAQLRGQRARRRGSGLGLTFCKLAVEAHGGRIWVEDNSGSGSVFSFTLPLAAIDRSRSTEELPSSAGGVPGLLLDDGD